MALTKAGYKRETFADILERLEGRARQLFGEDANVTARSGLGFALRIIAWGLSLAWQDNEDVYNSSYIDTAEGLQLDRLMPLFGITRNPATSSAGPVEFTGEPNTVVPLGTEVSTADDRIYITLEEQIINSEGKATVEVIAFDTGAGGNVDIGAINSILESVVGLESARNTEAFANGRDAESDAELRKRAKLSIEGIGSGTIASIKAELLQNQDIRAVYIDNNTEDEVSEYGTPSRAIQVFTLGGDKEDIAAAILKKKAAGIKAHGEVVVDTIDESEQIQKIGFTYSEIVQVWAKVTLRKNSDFEQSGVTQVKDALVQYVGGLDSSNVAHSGLGMGENVVLTKLIAAVYAVKGIEDVMIELSTDGENYVTGNLDLLRPQIAQLSTNSIEVI